MRAYTRNTLKRLELEEAVSGVARRSEVLTGPTPPPIGPSPSAVWLEFSAAFEQAARTSAQNNELDGLLRLAFCPRFSVRRAYRCGAERPLGEGWCASPYCPECATRRRAETIRGLREAWGPSPIVSVQIPVAPTEGKLGLPARTAVAAVRAAWAKVTARVSERTGQPRLEPMPRVVISPDGLHQFMRASSPTPDLLDAIRVECRRIGLRDVQVRSSSSEVAAREYAEATTLESTRFVETVRADLQRLAGSSWERRFPGDASREVALRACAHRWVEQVRSRRKEGRRHLVLGSKAALPTPASATAQGREPCPSHGSTCAAEAVYLRDLADHGRLVTQDPSDALSSDPRPREVGRLVERALAPRRGKSA